MPIKLRLKQRLQDLICAGNCRLTARDSNQIIQFVRKNLNNRHIRVYSKGQTAGENIPFQELAT